MLTLNPIAEIMQSLGVEQLPLWGRMERSIRGSEHYLSEAYPGYCLADFSVWIPPDQGDGKPSASCSCSSSLETPAPVAWRTGSRQHARIGLHFLSARAGKGRSGAYCQAG